MVCDISTLFNKTLPIFKIPNKFLDAIRNMVGNVAKGAQV